MAPVVPQGLNREPCDLRDLFVCEIYEAGLVFRKPFDYEKEILNKIEKLERL